MYPSRGSRSAEGAPRERSRSAPTETYSRIICLPCREDTIRGYSHISLLIIDEAARIPDARKRGQEPILR
jgi:hypothetical protein